MPSASDSVSRPSIARWTPTALRLLPGSDSGIAVMDIISASVHCGCDLSSIRPDVTGISGCGAP